jgi:CO dehydrogenase maturation factor
LDRINKIIAVTGKGGVGKTTVASLLITRLIRAGYNPVLAVDADPNMCLDAALGVTVEKTVGGVREEAKQLADNKITTGISKQQLLELKITESIIETNDFDLIAMGRPEGPGCYCYANNVMKSVLTELASHYPYIVLDNEAGLENLSRRLVQNVDLLIMVTDLSKKGFETVQRLYELSREMKIVYQQLAVIINRIRKSITQEQIYQFKSTVGADFVLCLPEEPEIVHLSENGDSIFTLSEQNSVVDRIDSFLKESLL